MSQCRQSDMGIPQWIGQPNKQSQLVGIKPLISREMALACPVGK
jgi:hypothetical protein